MKFLFVIEHPVSVIAHYHFIKKFCKTAYMSDLMPVTLIGTICVIKKVNA